MIAKAVFIVLAAGSGKRFGGAVPKQYLRWRARPLLYWSLANAAKAHRFLTRVVIALPKGDSLAGLKARGCIPAGFPLEIVTVTGAATRFGSLKKALRGAGDADFIFVHDAARPNWPAAWIGGMLKFLAHRKAAGAVPVSAVRETVKWVNGSLTTVPDRRLLHFSQTPQLARAQDLARALAKSREDVYLDEAQILETAGFKVLPYPGDPLNIKVTYPGDLRLLVRR
ncbi:MAG: 2-C-methyl-D-erythritol 4-phosphate cytidylyltransferase [Elusimicrobiota bacterium]